MLEEDKLKIGSKIKLISPDNIGGWKTTVGNVYKICDISQWGGKNRYHFMSDDDIEEWFTFDSLVIKCFNIKMKLIS
jgi:hypothetical protein